MKFLLKEIINFIFILFLLPLSFVIFIFNYNKVYKCDLLIYQKKGGFGHTFTLQDLLRYEFADKKIVYLHFYDPSRHNMRLNKIFGHKTITLPTVFYSNFLKTRFGEYEGSFFKIIETIILVFIKNKLSINQFYLYLEKKYKNSQIKKKDINRWTDIYFDLLKKKKKKNKFFFKQATFKK